MNVATGTGTMGSDWRAAGSLASGDDAASGTRDTEALAAPGISAQPAGHRALGKADTDGDSLVADDDGISSRLGKIVGVVTAVGAAFWLKGCVQRAMRLHSLDDIALIAALLLLLIIGGLAAMPMPVR